jgi:hypothetical protein
MLVTVVVSKNETFYPTAVSTATMLPEISVESLLTSFESYQATYCYNSTL